jgi:hypothetical protein
MKTCVLDIAVTGDGTGRWASGVRLHEAQGGVAAYEAGRVLDDTIDEMAALYQALVAALAQAWDRRGGQALEVRCCNAEFVGRITGDAADSPATQPLHEQAMTALLRWDVWRLVEADRGALRRALELAGAALRLDPDQIQALTADATAPAGPMRWSVRLMEDPGNDCPAGCTSRTIHKFGLTVPPGLCVHAAAAALADGPPRWTDPALRRMTTYCDHCDVPLRLERH